MNALRILPSRLISSLKSRMSGDSADKIVDDGNKGKGQSLLRLHEYQHRVIVELFRVSIAGFLTFSLVLLGMSFYALIDPYSPPWMSVIVALLSVVLLIGLIRTIKEFVRYRKNYEDITVRLRSKILKKSRPATESPSSSKMPIEHRLLSSLKPKEHGGWDHKSCKNCKKAIELLANVCQHCGQEQESTLVN